MTNLNMILLIIFGFIIVNIVRLSCTASLLTFYLSFGIIDCDGIFVQLGLKILLVDERHQLLTLTYIRL